MKAKKKIKLSFVAKNVLPISLLMLVVSFAVCSALYFYIKRIILDEYGRKLYNIASSVAKIIDKDKVIKYRDTQQMDDEYREIIKKLDIINSEMGLKYLYVHSWDSNGKRFTIYDATNPGDGIEDSAYNRDLLGTPGLPSPIVDKIISNNDLDSVYHEDNSIQYGHTISAYYPIKDNGKNIALVGADYSISEAMGYLYGIFIAFSNFILLSVVLSSLFLILFLKKKVVSPIQKISKVVNNFINLKSYKINIKPINLKVQPDSDIGILQESFNKMMHDIPMYIKHIQKITIEKEQISAELRIATKIQKSLIPHIFPAFPELNEIDLYATMKPAHKVGGDFYDFFLLENNRLAFIIADVSGKGIGAALFMVIAKTLIKNSASKFSTPAEIIKHVNEQLCSNNESGMFITAFFGILDLKTGIVNYTNAGHVNPILKSGKSNFEELNVSKQFVMAGMTNLNFKTQQFQMDKGDIVFLYTDGISEAIDKNSKYFGKNNLLQYLNSIDSQEKDLKYISDFIEEKIKEFEKGKEQTDDITMLIIKYNGQN